LAAKAQSSRRKRPHFAHLNVAGCQTGYETGVHLRAKQVIQKCGEVLLPDWSGDLLELPNPPWARDEDGHIHKGRMVDFPARHVVLREVELERSLGSLRPDVLAHDNDGELLIEIRVTHAVDDDKADQVRAQARRMVEIDLSQLDRATPHDPEAFEQAVLFDSTNRIWISHPQVLQDWRASKDDLDRQVAERNGWLREQRTLAALVAREHQERSARDKSSRREYVRQLERARYAEDLTQLGELTALTRVTRILQEYQVEAEARVSALLGRVPHAVRAVCLTGHSDAWIYGVDPALWQLLAHEHFVGKRTPGDRFNQRDVATWVRKAFPYEKTLYRLFVTQYAKRADARRAGFIKRRLAFWAFTDEENRLIPNFYNPINAFIERLVSAQMIRKLPSPIGECEVCPVPPSGFYPAAAVDEGRVSSTEQYI